MLDVLFIVINLPVSIRTKDELLPIQFVAVIDALYIVEIRTVTLKGPMSLLSNDDSNGCGDIDN